MGAHRLHITSKRRRQVFREKFVLIMIAAVAAICCSIIVSVNLVNARGTSAEDPIDYKYYKSIEVACGDTLWNIAETYGENHSSTNNYIKEVKEINNLDSDDIHEGQYLTVVYYDTEFK